MYLHRGQHSHFFVILITMCMFLVSACQTTSQQKPAPVKIEHRSLDLNARVMSDGYTQAPHNMPTTGVVDMSNILSSDKVQVFPLDGQTPDPFAGSRKRRTVFENTTSGGYTVLDQNVMVYPLEDGERPSYLPPYEGTHSNVMQQPQNDRPLIGSPLNAFGAPGSAVAEQDRQSVFASADDLPQIVESPKLSLQAPTKLKAPSPSPFDPQGQLLPHGRDFDAPILGGGPPQAETQPIGSSLTGYREYSPTTLSQEQQRAKRLNEYRSLADRAGTSMQNVPMNSQEPIAMQRRWSGSMTGGAGTSVQPVAPLPPSISANNGMTAPMIGSGASVSTQATGAPVQMAPVTANENLSIPPEQPRRTPKRGGMLTGY